MELMHELIEQMGTNAEQELNDCLTARAKIYAARMRLQHTVDQADGLDAIREIAANLMGCEELALYKVDHSRSMLWLYWSFGIDPNQHAALDISKDSSLAEALEGRIVYKETERAALVSPETPVTAIIPISVSDVIVAVLVIFRLLPQKSVLDRADRELCRVIANCGGRAIAPRVPNSLRGEFPCT